MSPAPRRRIAPASGADPAARAVLHAKAILKVLGRLAGQPSFWREAGDIRAERGQGRQVMSYPNPGKWTLDLAHPAVERILASGLPEDVQGGYLASVVYSAANMMMARVTDEQDYAFEASLAERLAKDAGRAKA